MLITWPLLSGSSEGKAVLLFVLIGSLLFFNSLIPRIGFLEPLNNKISSYSPDGRKLLKWTLILVVVTYILGIMIELMIRAKYGVSPFTIFVSLNPSPTTTSPMHSHVFKAFFGHLVSNMGGLVPSHIHTGSSLYQEVIPWAYFIVISLPIAYLTGLFSLNGRRDSQKIIMAFALALVLISMIDGGLYSQPAMIGLILLILLYFVRRPVNIRGIVVPVALIVLLLGSWIGFEVVGTNTSYHEIKVINEKESADLSSYNVQSLEKEGNVTVIRIITSGSDKETLESLFETYGGKADSFFITWNFFSYFGISSPDQLDDFN